MTEEALIKLKTDLLNFVDKWVITDYDLVQAFKAMLEEIDHLLDQYKKLK